MTITTRASEAVYGVHTVHVEHGYRETRERLCRIGAICKCRAEHVEAHIPAVLPATTSVGPCCNLLSILWKYTRLIFVYFGTAYISVASRNVADVRSGQTTHKLLTFTFTVFIDLSIMKSLIQPAMWALVGSCYASPLAKQIEKRQVESQMNDGKPFGVELDFSSN